MLANTWMFFRCNTSSKETFWGLLLLKWLVTINGGTGAHVGLHPWASPKSW